MGVMQFQLPGGVSTDDVDGLRRAYLAGGYDRSPVTTRAEVAGDRLILHQDKDESGFLSAPWAIPGIGRVIGCTTTLMERQTPYRLLSELARGKVNQVRSQMEDWRLGGLVVDAKVEEHIRKATAAFGQSALAVDGAEADRHAAEALTLAYEAAEALASLYVEQVFAFRREQNHHFDASVGCRLAVVPEGAIDDAYRLTFNSATVPLTWRLTEPSEANYQWEPADRVVSWALDRRLQVAAGPLIDFSSYGIPDWLRPWYGDLPSLSSFMCDFIETAVSRYRDRVRRWVICSGSNCAANLGLGEDDSIRLTARLAEAAWGIDSGLEVVIGMAQPWGEYLANYSFEYSPFVFADTLLRAGLPLAGLELEWHMGTWPRGTYCRDPLEASRLLDTFSMLGCDLQIAMSYASASDVDVLADPEQLIGRNGQWHDVSPLAQAEWAEMFAALALAKGRVIGVTWDHLDDAISHRFPQTGLVDVSGNKKPAFDRLRILRETHLRRAAGSVIA
jgi:hypothetical protein